MILPENSQEACDRFYMEHGPCCAGCDWWAHHNAAVGDCVKSAPVCASERWAMVGLEWATIATGAGHVVTPRQHVCGDFKDTFDWSTLPPAYLRRIGYGQSSTHTGTNPTSGR